MALRLVAALGERLHLRERPAPARIAVIPEEVPVEIVEVEHPRRSFDEHLVVERSESGEEIGCLGIVVKLHRALERGLAGLAVVAVALPARFRDRVRVAAAARGPCRGLLDVDPQDELQPFIRRLLLETSRYLLRPRGAKHTVVAHGPEHTPHILAGELAVDDPVRQRAGGILVVHERLDHRRKRLLRRAAEDLHEPPAVAEAPIAAGSPDVLDGRLHHLALGLRRLSPRIHLRHQERLELRVAE